MFIGYYRENAIIIMHKRKDDAGRDQSATMFGKSQNAVIKSGVIYDETIVAFVVVIFVN